MTPAGDPGVPEIDLTQRSVAELLRLYARILDELLVRRVIHSRAGSVALAGGWVRLDYGGGGCDGGCRSR